MAVLLGLALGTLAATSSDVWTQLGPTIVGEAPRDRAGFGTALSGDGRIVAVGSGGHHQGLEPAGVGHVRVFAHDEVTGSWDQLGADIDGEAGSNFGWGLALSADGHTVAVGAPNGNDASSGYVQVHTYSVATDTWTQLGQQLDGVADTDQFGIKLDISADGTVMAIGSFSHDDFRGEVRIFGHDETSDTWTQLGSDIEGDETGDWTGASVALSSDGTTVVVGSPEVNQATGGYVRAFTFDEVSGEWLQVGSDLVGDDADDRLGTSVSVSDDGNTILAGAVPAFGDGYVRVFAYNSAAWTQTGGDLTGAGTNSDSAFGSTASMSADGSTVGVGSGSFNIPAGRFQVFSHDDTADAWGQVGEPIEGAGANDAFATSVAMSDDGKTVAAGAPKNSDNGTESGHVRVFTLETRTPPVLDVPDEVIVDAISPAGGLATYSVTASDSLDGPLTPTCSPSSGGFFWVGQTTVTCTATNTADMTTSETFTVTVREYDDGTPPVDTTPPTLSGLPADITDVEASGPSGAVVSWPAPTAIDDVDPDPSVRCDPVSGSTFPVGTTTVTCTATDDAGNTSTETFDVTVAEPPAPGPDDTDTSDDDTSDDDSGDTGNTGGDDTEDADDGQDPQVLGDNDQSGGLDPAPVVDDDQTTGAPTAEEGEDRVVDVEDEQLARAGSPIGPSLTTALLLLLVGTLVILRTGDRRPRRVRSRGA